MIRPSSKSGFTLLEMLVASLLLGMLVSILTMVFNSSSIAWRTGKAGVAQLSKLRRQMSFAQHRADNLLPRVNAAQANNELGFVISPWCTERKNGGKFLRTRAVQRITSSSLGLRDSLNFSTLESDVDNLGGASYPWLKLGNLEKLKLGSASSYTVGVLSCGPDGKRETEDDNITTWPEIVE